VNRASQTQEKASGEDDGVDLGDVSATDQSVYAVFSIDHFILLRTENDYSVAVLQQLDEVASLMSQQVSASFCRTSLYKSR